MMMWQLYATNTEMYNFYYFLFEKPQKSITSGQFIAVYSDDELVCSGVIH